MKKFLLGTVAALVLLTGCNEEKKAPAAQTETTAPAQEVKAPATQTETTAPAQETKAEETSTPAQTENK